MHWRGDGNDIGNNDLDSSDDGYDEEDDCDDYAERAHEFLIEKENQQADIECSAKEVYALINLPDDEIIEMTGLASSATIDSGHLHMQIIRELSMVPKIQRKDILALARLFCGDSSTFIERQRNTPEIIEALSKVPVNERKDFISLVSPINTSCTSWHYLEDSLANFMSLVIEMPALERRAVMTRLWPLVTYLEDLLTKYHHRYWTKIDIYTCEFLIDEIKSIPEKEREKVLSYTRRFAESTLLTHCYSPRTFNHARKKKYGFYDNHEVGLLNLIRSAKAIPTEEWESIRDDNIKDLAKYARSYAEYLDLVVVALRMPSSERSNVIREAHNIITAQKHWHFSDTFRALSHFSEKQRLDLSPYAFALARKMDGEKSGNDFSRILSALAQLSSGFRSDIFFFCLSLPDNLMDSRDLEDVIEHLGRVPRGERARLIEMLQTLVRDLGIARRDEFRWLENFLESMAAIPLNEREVVFLHLAALLKKGWQGSFSDFIKVVGKMPLSEITATISTVEDFLPPDKQKWNFFGSFAAFAQVPPDEREGLTSLIRTVKLKISDLSYSDLIGSLLKIPPAERNDIAISLCSIGEINNACGYYCSKIIEALATIPSSERASVLARIQCLLKVVQPYRYPDVLEIFKDIAPEQRDSVIIHALLLLERATAKSASSIHDETLDIIKRVAGLSAKDRQSVVLCAVRLSSGLPFGQYVITPVDSAPQIKMPSNPYSIILRVLAQVSDEERSGVVDLASNFRIKELGVGYAALVVKELVYIPKNKRSVAATAYKLGDKASLRYEKEEARKRFREGFDAFVEYLTKVTFSELFRLMLAAASANIPEHAKQKFWKYTETVFLTMPESDVGNFVISVASLFNLKP